MILYVLKQNKNSKSAAFGKWFAFPVIEETIDLDALAEHMSNHNTPYSKGAIKGMLTDMVGCIKELLLEGKKNIKGVKLRARATGELIAKSLNLEATLKKASATTKSTSTTNGGGGTTNGGTTNSTNDGGGSNTGGSGENTNPTNPTNDGGDDNGGLGQN